MVLRNIHILQKIDDGIDKVSHAFGGRRMCSLYLCGYHNLEDYSSFCKEISEKISVILSSQMHLIFLQVSCFLPDLPIQVLLYVIQVLRGDEKRSITLYLPRSFESHLDSLRSEVSKVVVFWSILTHVRTVLLRDFEGQAKQNVNYCEKDKHTLTFRLSSEGTVVIDGLLTLTRVMNATDMKYGFSRIFLFIKWCQFPVILEISSLLHDFSNSKGLLLLLLGHPNLRVKIKTHVAYLPKCMIKEELSRLYLASCVSSPTVEYFLSEVFPTNISVLSWIGWKTILSKNLQCNILTRVKLSSGNRYYLPSFLAKNNNFDETSLLSFLEFCVNLGFIDT